jgi:hypothetical protein
MATELLKAEKELEAQLVGVRSAISSLVKSGIIIIGGRRGAQERGIIIVGGKRGRPAAARKSIIIHGKTGRKRKPMSKAARAKIAAAQRRRWAKQKAETK